MRIAILTSGIMPVPAVQGGAVENLIDFYLERNNICCEHDITVYSVWHPSVRKHPALQSKYNHYVYIDMSSLLAKYRKYIYQKLQQDEYYHYSIEYFFEQAYKNLQQEKYDLIIIENRPGYILKLKERTTTPCILHLHNDFLNKNTKCANEIIAGYDKIISVSNYITNRVKEVNPTFSDKCHTVYNAIDTALFQKTTPADRESIGLKDSDFVIVYSGRLTEEKGILQLVMAIKRLDMIPNLKLLVIGANAYGNDTQHTPLIEQLKREASDIRDKVVFTGFVSYSKIPSFLKLADIAVVPSMWEEPFGLTVVEAMAAHLPLIATRSGGIPEICENNAIIVEREDIVDNLTSAILDLYLHPEKREAMGKASLAHSAYYNKQRYAEDFFKAIG